jgi:hypothetical protein
VVVVVVFAFESDDDWLFETTHTTTTRKV